MPFFDLVRFFSKKFTKRYFFSKLFQILRQKINIWHIPDCKKLLLLKIMLLWIVFICFTKYYIAISFAVVKDYASLNSILISYFMAKFNLKIYKWYQQEYLPLYALKFSNFHVKLLTCPFIWISWIRIILTCRFNNDCMWGNT